MKKITLISLVLVVALGLMGVGFALWSDSLFISGTVNTGNIGLTWSAGIPTDDEIEGKDVSSASVAIVGDTMTIIVTDAYPCITYTIPIDLHGVGSVPVHTKMTLVSSTGESYWVTIPDMTGLQIHQGGVWDGVITIHLDNLADQLSQYTFTVQLDYWQYNEDDVALPLVPFQ